MKVDSTIQRRRSEGDARQQNQPITNNTTKPPTNPNQPVTNTDPKEVPDIPDHRRTSLDSASECFTLNATSHPLASHNSSDMVKCRHPRCENRATIAESRKTFKSCHNCSHMYCSRECRRQHWERHRKACLHTRVSALCRQVLAACKDDPNTLRSISLMARRGFLQSGRGLVRILFRSPEDAELFLRQGFQKLGEASYMRWPDLVPAEMGPELYAELLRLCTEYKTESKMLIYVAICVVSEVPSTRKSAPVRWERQLVSRCAKLKLCKAALRELEETKDVAQDGSTCDLPTDILILTFNATQRIAAQEKRELILRNVKGILQRRGVYPKNYPEVLHRLNMFVEGITDRFIPVTLHPRDVNTGREFVCIIMPNTEATMIMPKDTADNENVQIFNLSEENLVF